jgi:predicted CXXCH cytochrome family protein
MQRLKTIKAAVAAAGLAATLLVAGGNWLPESTAKSEAAVDQKPPTPPQGKANPADYVGTDTCAGCHSDQHATFEKTTHAKLLKDPSWKDKVVGCESCHGAGRAHVETMSEAIANGTDPFQVKDKKIIYLAGLPAKAVSETCLQCHAGREEHNNYRRGEHWRNDVGCTDCHFAHKPDPAPPRAESHTLISENTRKGPDVSVLKMLRGNEAQMCLRCHEEQKSDFSRPFRHKVLEGVMKCSDCHNPHGGFELKQTRLANFSASEAACVKCHNDKAGPFVYEHGPVTVEGCSSCHTPHGSTNQKLLKRNQMFQLCIECHTNAHAVGLGGEEAAPNTPSFHNLTDAARIQNCTLCHVSIHGSNIHPFFFR